MFKCLCVIIFLYFFFDIFVFSVYVSPSRPSPSSLTHNLPCKILIESRIMLRTFLSYKYVTIDLIKMISLVFPWILILSPNITRTNVKYVNFCWNLSLLPRHNDTILLFNHTFKSCLFVCTFLSLYEPFLLFFAIDKTFLSHFPNRNTVVAFNMCLFFKLHRTCFLIFKYTIISVIIIVYSFLSIPCATLWYFQLVINLSNDISKKSWTSIPK